MLLRCSARLPLCQAGPSGAYFTNRGVASTATAALPTPNVLVPFFNYMSDCNMTVAVQTYMEAISTTAGTSWGTTFVLSAFGLRLLVAPIQIYTEKLIARRAHAEKLIAGEIVQKVSDHYGIRRAATSPEFPLGALANAEPAIQQHAEKLLRDNIGLLAAREGLAFSRIQNLRSCVVPIWVMSSFALRNIITSDWHPPMPGALWVPDFLLPDPYFILPVSVGLFGFLNFWSHRRVSSALQKQPSKVYTGLLTGFLCLVVVILAKQPACIPLYWLAVSLSGFGLQQALRHPRLKGALGILPLPSDSYAPLRSLVFGKGVGGKP